MNTQLNGLLCFLAGLLSFLSPCVLAIAPAYVSYISGVEAMEEERKKVFIHTFLFVLGFTGVFVLIGVGASFLGTFLLRYKMWFNRISGLVIMVFGLQILGILKIRWMYAEKRIHPRQTWAELRSFFLGITFGLGWTPCIGPILGSILLYVSTFGNMVQGAFFLLLYALGLALPFLLLGMGWGYMMSLFRSIQKRGRLIEIISGILLLFLGCIIFFNQMNTIINVLRLGNLFPSESFLSPE